MKYIEEPPNLDYLFELSAADTDFEHEFMSVFKEEFIRQLGNYIYHIKKDEPRAAAELVFELKYKFGILGMPRAVDLAEYHEKRLHVGDTAMDDDFRKILKNVKDFLSAF